MDSFFTGHKLEEIRVRALNSVVSKLEYGFVSEKELIAQKDLVVKLLDWFNFETCPEAEKVLNLILRLIKVRTVLLCFVSLIRERVAWSVASVR
jgi:rotatin